MDDLNNEYYVLEPENNSNYPMIGAYLTPDVYGEAISGDYSLMLYLATPIPKNPQYVDFHTEASAPVVSEAFVNLLEPLNIHGIQFLKGTKGNVVEELKLNYHLLNIYSSIQCLDTDNSDVDLDDGDIFDLRSFTLNSEKLSNTPEQKRLVFELYEYSTIKLFHQSVVDKIESANLKGMRFIPVKEWSDNLAFS